MMSTGWISISIVRVLRRRHHGTSSAGGIKEALQRRGVTMEGEWLESDKGTWGEKRG